MMTGFLLDTKERYYFGSVEEAQAYLDKRRAESPYEIKHYDITKKVKKSKGEIVDEWVILSFTVSCNDEKEPEKIIYLTYGRGGNNDED